MSALLLSYLLTSLKQCKHLILIGDHQQLKPNPNVYELARDYHLDMSLFERMVKNGVPLKTLDTQHRMRPEVSKFMKHIYAKLDDHESVLNRDLVEGMKSPVYFFNHSTKETADEMTMSHSNAFEADMVVGLTRYLLSQESYTTKDITIITMYTGQLLLIKNKMPKREFEGINITSVDNFQGMEENKIIIISLVRSNDVNNLGL
ncbi:ZNFX1 [Bugula neritina]|uniref:ZNFX1 n=1 Tax=Bugula neritina TaxID=10212 RepID=A0A7J7J6F8_BUGNE|nr:ZNFX1 [Bugula neritina]